MIAGDRFAQSIEDEPATPYLSWTRTAILTSWAAAIGSPFWVMWYRMVAHKLPGRPLAMVAVTAAIAPAVNVAFFAYCTTAEHFAHVPRHGIPSAGDQLVPAIAFRLEESLPRTLAASMTVWPITNYFNFRFVPLHLRNLVGSGVAVLWNVYLSLMQHHGARAPVAGELRVIPIPSTPAVLCGGGSSSSSRRESEMR